MRGKGRVTSRLKSTVLERFSYASSDVVMTIELAKAMAREKLDLGPEVNVTGKVVGDHALVFYAFEDLIGIKYKRSMVSADSRYVITKCERRTGLNSDYVPARPRVFQVFGSARHGSSRRSLRLLRMREA